MVQVFVFEDINPGANKYATPSIACDINDAVNKFLLWLHEKQPSKMNLQNNLQTQWRYRFQKMTIFQINLMGFLFHKRKLIYLQRQKMGKTFLVIR